VTEHPRLGEIWLDLVEGSLPAAEAERARAHLAGCAECSRELDRLAAVHRLSSAVGGAVRAAATEDAGPGPDLDARVLAAARAAARASAPRAQAGAQARLASRPPRRRAWIAAGATVAAAAAAFLALRWPGAGLGDPFAPALSTVADAGAGAGELRGDGVPSAEGAAIAAEVRTGVAAGRLRVEKASPPPCVPGERGRAAVLDPSGRLRAFFWSLDGATEVHLYREDGAPAAAFRVDASGRVARVPALAGGAARAALVGSACGVLQHR
jgi:hypothetical protein